MFDRVTAPEQRVELVGSSKRNELETRACTDAGCRVHNDTNAIPLTHSHDVSLCRRTKDGGKGHRQSAIAIVRWERLCDLLEACCTW